MNPVSPWYFFIERNTKGIEYYNNWIKVNEIFPVNVTGIVTARDNLAIDFELRSLRNKIILFRDKNTPDSVIKDIFEISDNYQWKLIEQRELFRRVIDWNEHFTTILYRPFDHRFIYYQDNIVFRTRREVMGHMLKDNIGIGLSKRVEIDEDYSHVFITNELITHHSVSLKEVNALFPLYLYQSTEPRKKRTGFQTMMLFEPEAEYDKAGKKPNISPKVFEQLEQTYGKKPSPEQILYYCYAVLYSNTYRKSMQNS